MNKNSFKKEQQKQYEIKMAWLKSEQVETFFAYACIVLFFLFLEIPLWIFPFV